MAYLKEYSLNTSNNGMVAITGEVEKAVRESGVSEGVAVVFCPHTTAGITINENADPDVVRDIGYTLDRVFPKLSGYRHMEGNSDAHVKSSLTGAGETVIIQDGKLLLGTWQGLYFCEYDGPRTRHYYVKILEG